MGAPRVSVIVPVHNTEAYIREALDSLFAQDYPDLEIIVVDDGSTDSTPDILREYGGRIVVLTQANAGPSVARNRGIKAATGSVLGFLDADDLWTEDHLKHLLPHLTDHDLARGFTMYFKDGPEGRQTLPPMALDMLVGSILCTRACMETVGLFNESMRYGEDVDWNARAREAGILQKQVADTVLWYRRHEKNVTNLKDSTRVGLVDAVRRRMLRNNAKQGL